MQLFIDSADVQEIEKIHSYYPISGVTTNPTLLAKSVEEKNALDILKEIRMIIGADKPLFVQTLSESCDEIITEAHAIRKHLSGEIVIKIPATDDGIKAIKALSKEKVSTLVTTIYTPMQAMIAALAGADYVAPYVNRIDDNMSDGVKVVEQIASLYKEKAYDCNILGASFKNVQQIYDTCMVGADSITVAPDIIDKFLNVPMTSRDIEKFQIDWHDHFGKQSAW